MNPFRNPSVEVGVTLVRRQDRFQPGVDYVDPPPGYGLVELNARWEMVIGGHLCQTSFSVSNMFNKSYRDYLSRYRYFVDDPGRDITVRIQIPFGQTP
jgi:iron complex outermembrane receptor protein